MPTWENIEMLAEQWMREAGEIITNSFEEELTIDTKSSKTDFVTNIDKKVERFLIDNIKSTFPKHRILGEEGYGDKLDDLNGVVWIVDPIDGTTNFIHQQANFAISIGVYENGIGKLGLIYDVVNKLMCVGKKDGGAYLDGVLLPKLSRKVVSEAIISMNAFWITDKCPIDPEILRRLAMDVRAIRSYGSAALEIAYIAMSRIDTYVSLRLAPWDYAAGKVIIEEVGGVITQLSGEPITLLQACPVLVARPGLHEQIVEEYLKPHL